MNITSLNLFQETLQKCSGTPETKMRFGTLWQVLEKKCVRSSLIAHNAKEPQGKTKEKPDPEVYVLPHTPEHKDSVALGKDTGIIYQYHLEVLPSLKSVVSLWMWANRLSDKWWRRSYATCPRSYTCHEDKPEVSEYDIPFYRYLRHIDGTDKITPVTFRSWD